jgi:hypothetical protein
MKPFFASWQLYGAKLQGGRHGWRPGAKKGGSATSEGEAEEAARCLWIGVGDHQPRIGKIYHTTRIICLQFLLMSINKDKSKQPKKSRNARQKKVCVLTGKDGRY